MNEHSQPDTSATDQSQAKVPAGEAVRQGRPTGEELTSQQVLEAGQRGGLAAQETIAAHQQAESEHQEKSSAPDAHQDK